MLSLDGTVHTDAEPTALLSPLARSARQQQQPGGGARTHHRRSSSATIELEASGRACSLEASGRACSLEDDRLLLLPVTNSMSCQGSPRSGGSGGGLSQPGSGACTSLKRSPSASATASAAHTPRAASRLGLAAGVVASSVFASAQQQQQQHRRGGGGGPAAGGAAGMMERAFSLTRLLTRRSAGNLEELLVRHFLPSGVSCVCWWCVPCVQRPGTLPRGPRASNLAPRRAPLIPRLPAPQLPPIRPHTPPQVCADQGGGSGNGAPSDLAEPLLGGGELDADDGPPLVSAAAAAAQMMSSRVGLLRNRRCESPLPRRPRSAPESNGGAVAGKSL